MVHQCEVVDCILSKNRVLLVPVRVGGSGGYADGFARDGPWRSDQKCALAWIVETLVHQAWMRMLLKKVLYE